VDAKCSPSHSPGPDQTHDYIRQRQSRLDKLARQKKRGKLNARERLEGLLDFDGFDEIGALAGKGRYTENGDLIDSAPSNFIFGRGRINGRTVVATADDFTVRGGASDAAIYRKFILAEQMVHELRLPFIRMIDGTGGGGSVKSLEDMGHTYVPMVPGWDHVVKNLETVPVVALALGPTAGLGAARAVASHYSVMVKGLSQIFTAGPAVESLGGSAIHTRNGVIDDEAADEAEAFARARAFLSYLPDYAGARRATITAFARLDGWPVAVLANDPMFLGGSWTADTAEKAKRFVELAELFGMPVVNLVDNPGFMIGLEAERTATIRRGVEAMNGIYRATMPWASVIVRKAYGVAGAAMSNAERFPYRVAWPSGDWGSLHIKCVEKICHLNNNLDDYGVIFQLPNLVRQEIDHVNTPEYVKRRACDFIYTTMTPLKPDESILSANLRSHFKGNGVGDRHTADSNHIFEALKYGAGYFITEDARIKKKSNALDIRVLSRHEFIVVLDKFEIL